MQTVDVNAWKNLSDTVFVPHTETEYNRLVSMLDSLIDEVGEDETHPLASLMDVLSALIEKFMPYNARTILLLICLTVPLFVMS